jgi:hypothetical protein
MVALLAPATARRDGAGGERVRARDADRGRADRGRGALLAFRQDDEAPTRRIALRARPPGRRFRLRAAPDGGLVATATSAELSRGLDVTLPKRGARVLLVEPAA